ncbi:nerve growth factor receptor b [Polymixia lowei]
MNEAEAASLCDEKQINGVCSRAARYRSSGAWVRASAPISYMCLEPRVPAAPCWRSVAARPRGSVLEVGALANQEPCYSGQFTTDGECCRQCPPGEGVIKPCGATQTVCSPCLDSETFSENFSHTERCRSCTRCTSLLRMQTPCTDSNDAVCVCDYGYYLDRLSARCERCTRCPEGQGMLYACEHNRDTVCEECTVDTYSDQESSREPCLPCTICDEGEELQIQACTSLKDTVCKDLRPPPDPSPFTPSEPYDDLPDVPPPYGSTDTPITTTDGPQLIPQGLNDKLIPIYCSILAAVVVGLVAFIIFKRWNSCKQNKQGANNCTANQNQTPSPEGEKLHSDSGISVDSQSLQEQQGQTQAQTVVTMAEEPCLLLPLHTREEVEKLLFRGCEGDTPDHIEDSDWCNLAGLLGYEEERIASFRQEEHPVRALLSDWAGQDCASMDTLCTALRKINRDDVAQSLLLSPGATKPTATSVV